MGVLNDVKREKFCQAMVRLKNPKECCEKGGFKYSPSQYSHLKAEKKVQDRIKELMEESVEKGDAVMDLSERLETLTKIIKDPLTKKTILLRAIYMLHIMSGDHVTKSDVNIKGSLNDVKMVEVVLPTVKEKNKDDELDECDLDNIEKFLRDSDI